MSDCLFCKIIAGEIPSEQVYEDELILVFKDIFPKAPVHLLIVPKVHIESLEDISVKDSEIITHITCKLKELAYEQGFEQGFRTIINTGPGGGQEVPHLHYHLLGGKKSLGGF